ncbi:uncharacterized protein EI90DRAFT_2920645 [Cantharellus anzutake]|uniref:uncharacterized protein n=1 Tax=Cantharellus anzutake TaxID=1750568 RepID=UPI001908F054|nr:uncharacterized protein EI90DRAFT_2920645 [Cantharellus anzutake]KAF8331074.1 hypothetical protein EI90DRAFT_2920645 [Cantharellus anzutake]
MSALPPTFLYPSAVEEANSISYNAKRAKIARHSPCSASGCTCLGLHPPPGWQAMADDSEDVGIVLDMAEFSEELTDEGHLKICDCGHSFEDHGCDDSIDLEEFNRRARAAVRIDELLENKGQLLNFEYTDEDILSLRKSVIGNEGANS